MEKVKEIQSVLNKADFLKIIDKTYQITIVDDERDTQPVEVSLTKEKLFEVFSKHRITETKSTIGFVPGVFKTESRSAEEILKISMLVYDVDCKTRSYSLEQLKSKLKQYSCIVYSTFTASYEHPKWRVIILLERSITPAEFKSQYLQLATELDLEIDMQCTNINRLFYLPSVNKHNDFQQCWSNKGKDLKVTKQKRNQSIAVKDVSKKKVNRGYVTFSSVDFDNVKVNSDRIICGYSVPNSLHAPFSQSEFDNLLCNPGTWLKLATYLGLPVEGISTNHSYSKSFSSIIPNVEDKNPSCNLALLTSNKKTRLVYMAFNEKHDNPNNTGPVIFDLARIYAMMHSGRRIERDAFPPATHKVWLTRLLIASGMIIAEPVKDLPKLPDELKSCSRLYDGFKQLLQCKRSFKEQSSDATAFSLTFACYWCKIGNRNTVKKYTEQLLTKNIFRFVDKLKLARGGSIPLLMPAGKSAQIYKFKQQKFRKNKTTPTKEDDRVDTNKSNNKATYNPIINIENLRNKKLNTGLEHILLTEFDYPPNIDVYSLCISQTKRNLVKLE